MRFQNGAQRQKFCRFSRRRGGSKKRANAHKKQRDSLFRLHPLFLLVGAWYCFKGELFVFLMSCLVALQHECAHAFAAAKLGYRLNRIVLMPFGAVIDGDLRGISLKDEITVALYGPLCNLFTAAFFAALWWFAPTMYAFTDTACYSSLSVALVNFLPAYPLDGGRIFYCVLARALLRRQPQQGKAERTARKISRAVTLVFSALCFALFIATVFSGNVNISLFTFSAFLFFGVFGNKNEPAFYDKIDYSAKDAIKKGVELRRVAVGADCPIKDALRYVSRGSYLVLEVYDENENKLFELPQNGLDEYFRRAPTPYTPLGALYLQEMGAKRGKIATEEGKTPCKSGKAVLY